MRRLALLAVSLLLPVAGFAQSPVDGLTLISPSGSSQSWLIELDGTVAHTWTHDGPHGRSSYVLEDGSLLLPLFDPNGQFSFGGAGGRIQRLDLDSNVQWDYLLSDSDYQQHHDIAVMPNGNVLAIAWERRTAAEAEALGKTNLAGAEMWPTAVFEIEPVGLTDGNIVWEWHLWDHLIQDTDPAKPGYGVIADHPELVDINLSTATNGSWDHANGIDYDPVRDEILLSCHRLSEVLVIDHSTTTAEAAGHSGGQRGKGGDILYRWGNPANYGRPGPRQLFGVHGADWIDEGLPGAGNILVYNNGNRAGSLSDNSSAEEVAPVRDVNGDYVIAAGASFEPAAADWKYDDPGNFFSPRFGSAQRMPNGNTLINVGLGGLVFEVTSLGQVVWEYQGPNDIFAARRYFNLRPVPVLVHSSSLAWMRDHVEMRWRFVSDVANPEFVVLRRASHRFEELDSVQVTGEGLVFHFEDAQVESGQSYDYRVEVRSAGQVLAVIEESVTVPAYPVALSEAFPNPFNPRTRFEFALPKSGAVELTVHDVRGRRVATIIDGWHPAGRHAAEWDGQDASKRPVASGSYFFRLRTQGRQVVRKAVLVQ